VTGYTTERERRRAQRRSRNKLARVLIALVLLALAFLLGIAFAQALDERPERSDVTTGVRTLTPMEQQSPASTSTVTVTVTSP
jgi:predicted metal-binding membrane protein